MPELRKRKAPEAETPAPLEKPNSQKSPRVESMQKAVSTSKMPVVGESVDLAAFGGIIETNDAEHVNLKTLVDESQSGVVIFTYPKASTPGCTTQACLFRDEYTSLTATGFAIYGLSADSPKANASFKTKQKLPYKLLCDPKKSLIGAIGMKKAPNGTTRGVFVVDKGGIVKAMSAGGPAATVDIVRKLIDEDKDERGQVGGETAKAKKVDVSGSEGTVGDQAKAETAAQVADTAQKLDQ